MFELFSTKLFALRSEGRKFLCLSEQAVSCCYDVIISNAHDFPFEGYKLASHMRLIHHTSDYK